MKKLSCNKVVEILTDCDGQLKREFLNPIAQVLVNRAVMVEGDEMAVSEMEYEWFKACVRAEKRSESSHPCL